MKKQISLTLVFCIFAFAFMPADNTPALKFGLLKYSGGGDWYSNPTALPNLAKFCNKNLHTNIDPKIYFNIRTSCHLRKAFLYK